MPFTIGGDWITPASTEPEKPRRPIKVRREKRGRSFVTVVLNLHQPAEEIKLLLKGLKKHFACGGTAKSGVIELQGDREEDVRAHLRSMGIKAQ
jgi:translation initiation factor 1